jgi:hypothetical protein
MGKFLMSPALALPRCDVSVGQVIAFPASSEGAPRLLSAAAGEMVRSISAILEDLVLCALEKRTAADFDALRNEVFPKYFEAMRALSSLTTIMVPGHVIDRVSNEFFCEMEAECREYALAAFGAEVRDQLMFTIWTLRKTSDLCRMIVAAPAVPENRKVLDSEVSFKYAQTVVWARFHMDCLFKAMQLRRPIHPEVYGLVIDGLRGAVNAYAWARQGLDLRVPRSEPTVASVEWDEEDRALLNEATFDMLGESA